MLWSYRISTRCPYFRALYEGKGTKVKGLERKALEGGALTDEGRRTKDEGNGARHACRAPTFDYSLIDLGVTQLEEAGSAGILPAPLLRIADSVERSFSTVVVGGFQALAVTSALNCVTVVLQ